MRPGDGGLTVSREPARDDMRIAFTSDLHADVGVRNAAALPWAARAAAALVPDVFVLAGDAANDLAALDRTLAAFEALPARKLFVPGNHDLWIESNTSLRRGQDSWHKHVRAIPDVCARRGFHSLPGAPVRVGDVGFAGSVGWYDYSLRDPRLEATVRPIDYERGEFRDAAGVPVLWNDVKLAAWLARPEARGWQLRRQRLTNAEVFDRVHALLGNDLEALAGVREIVAVLHTNPFAECLERKSEPDPFDAYEGSTALGELLARHAAHLQVTCICGHRHRPLDLTVRGVRVLRRPLGYLDRSNAPVEELAAEAVGILELPELVPTAGARPPRSGTPRARSPAE